MQRLTSFLSGTPELRAMARKAGRLAALERCYRTCIPQALAKASRIAGFDRQNLVISADNGAIAAKLRQLAPHILNMIQENQPEITGILVRVQVGSLPPALNRQPATLSPAGKKRLDDFAASLDNSPLKKAIKKLTRR